jgi:hypothetical protein
MESRWKEAVALIDSWHKRITDGGDSTNIDELQSGIQVPSNLDTVKGVRNGEISEKQQSSSVYLDEIRHRESVSEFGEGRDHETRKIAASIKNPKLSKHGPLEQTTGNIGSEESRRKVSFQNDSMDAPSDGSENEDENTAKGSRVGAVTQRPARKKTEPRMSRQVRNAKAS